MAADVDGECLSAVKSRPLGVKGLWWYNQGFKVVVRSPATQWLRCACSSCPPSNKTRLNTPHDKARIMLGHAKYVRIACSLLLGLDADVSQPLLSAGRAAR